ncbi:MAG: phosphotransferase [Deltaproteobacteria bacterium]|nr:phosphotransferase [Deltaproteobacteria bacterium]
MSEGPSISGETAPSVGRDLPARSRSRGVEPGAALSNSGPAADPALAQSLLLYLRDRLAVPSLAYQGEPHALLGGTEAAVLAFQLAGAPPPFDGPLVLRRFRRGQAPERSVIEAGIHDAARDAGFPTPACLLHESSREILGGAFLVLERVEGEALLSGLAVETLAKGLNVRSLLRTIGKTPGLWGSVATHVADAAVLVSNVDAVAVEAAVRARGGTAEFLSLDARLARIERRIVRTSLGEPLAPALAWLEANRPPSPERRCLVHGDIAPTNLMVHDGQLTGVLDWSKALLAEPEAEIGFLRVAIRTAAIMGLGRWNRALTWPLANFANRVTHRYIASRPVDLERVRWYETLRAVSLLASIAKREKKRARRRRRHILDGGGSSRAIGLELERLTGERVVLG